MQQLVIRVCSAFVISPVTGKTVGWGRGVVARGMAAGTILYVMPLRQRKEVVPYALCVPVVGRHVMTFGAIGGKTRLRVIRIGCSIVILRMTVHTRIPQSVKSKHRLGCMAGIAVRTRMRTREREAVLLVQPENVIDLPVIGIVTTGTVVSDSHLVQIGMTRDTVTGSLFKHHGGVTGTTVCLPVASGERERCLTVVRKFGGIGSRWCSGRINKLIFSPLLPGNLPAVRRMTGRTVHSHCFTVRRLRSNPCCKRKQQDDGEFE